MMTAAFSEVVINNDALGTEVEDVWINLPIYNKVEINNEDDGGKDTSREHARFKFENELTKTGRFVDFSDYDEINGAETSSWLIDRVCLKLLNDCTTLVLTPLLFNNHLNFTLNNFHLKLPDTVYNENCLSVFVKKDGIIIDLLTLNGLLISLYFHIEDFIKKSENGIGNEKNLVPIEKWCHYDVPYSFELRNAFSIHSLSENLIIVPLIDGGLLEFKRESMFSSIGALNFNDSSYFNNLAKKLFFLNKGKNQDLIDNININTILDMKIFNKIYLVTLSINKILRIWSLLNHTIVFEKNLEKIITNDGIENNNNNNNDFLSLNLSNAIEFIDHDKFIIIANHSKLNILQIIENKKNDYELTIKMLKIIDLPIDQNKKLNWVIQSLKIYKDGKNFLKIFLMSKSNYFKKIQMNKLQLDTFNYEWYTLIEQHLAQQQFSQQQQHQNQHVIDRDDEFPLWEKYLNSKDSINTYYIDKVLRIYNKSILETISSIFESYYDYHPELKLSLQQRILAINNFAAKDDDTNNFKRLKNQWARFDGSCKELLKQCLEPIAIDYDLKKNLVLVLKNLHYSIYKPCDLIENSIYNKDEEKLSRYLDVINGFGLNFNSITIYEFKRQLLQIKDDDVESKMVFIFDNLLSKYLTEEIVNQLLINLNLIPNLIEILEFIVNYFTNYSEEQFIPINEKFGNLGSEFFINTFKSKLLVDEAILINTCIVLLILNSNDKILKIFQDLNHIFKKLKHIDVILNINIDSSSFFLKIINKEFNYSGFNLNGNSLNKLNQLIVNRVVQTDFLLQSLISSLISLKHSELIVKKKIIDYLKDNVIDNFLKGLVFLNSNNQEIAYELFVSNCDNIINYQLGKQDLKNLSDISRFLILFDAESKIKYYLLLVNFFKEVPNSLNQSFKLTKLTIDELIGDNITKYNDIVYWNFFQISLSLNNYENSITALNNFKAMNLVEKSLNLLVLTLLEKNKINLIVSFKNLFTSKGLIFAMDTILSNLTEEESIQKRSLKYHKILYSWRLNNDDYRGASQALYQYINRFYINSDLTTLNAAQRKEIQDLYLIVENTLNVIEEDDDRWLLTNINGHRAVVTLKDLKKEHKQVAAAAAAIAASS
ncbi:hypothetical protein PACTADRAFT_78920 [Pachysolen tannophilus NRRL Y-2460]|uniref:Uncharacterized protein n=1 Tax=Pachysolen tannophilus NRRL Y-2460 TaxID=669874 RepID=A0A1E4U3I0_PACTA|nr:hypothetical protein PACTADRAFT_78920 [Pachysolen tannophilus NRRL Y-2460]